jgi:hypothetical protein
MYAHPGDQIRIKGHHVGEIERRGEILAARGTDGTPPFMVRWDDNDHVVLFFPSNDAVIDDLSSHAGADR